MSDLREQEYRRGYSKGYNAGKIRGKREYADTKKYWLDKAIDAIKANRHREDIEKAIEALKNE